MTIKTSIKIIEDNKDYLIINKPAGLIVHGGKNINEATLVDWLLKKYPSLKKVGEDLERPAIVHRLDKEASGLMIIPKNNKSFEYFKGLFKNRKIKKEYIALVFGQTPKDEGVIDFPIRRSSQGHKMAALPKNTKEVEDDKKISNRDMGNIRAIKSSRSAVTEFRVIKRLINFTLVQVKIKTGRTHQIRVHFSAYGHPLLGDKLYGNKKSKLKNLKIKTERLFLMANKLGFHDQEGNAKEFSVDLSPDLKELLNKVK